MRWKTFLPVFVVMFCFSALAMARPDPPPSCNVSDSPGMLITDGWQTTEIVIPGPMSTIPKGGLSIDVVTDSMKPKTLTMSITSPDGTKILLWAAGKTAQSKGKPPRPPRPPTPFEGNFPDTLTPFASLGKLTGERMDGTWTLGCYIFRGSPSATLISWGINGCGTPVLSGDCDGDGDLSRADLRSIKGLIGTNSDDKDFVLAADINDDGQIWYDDLRLLLRLIRNKKNDS